MADFRIVIQARTTSTRLPRKVLLPLCGMSVLEVMLKRLERFRENILVATTDDGTEKEIVEICRQHPVDYCQGSTDDVLGRFYQGLKALNFKPEDIVVRLTSDCPLMDAALIANMLEKYRQSHGGGYFSNTLKRTYPRGLDVEIFTFEMLEMAHFQATETHEREHVTPFFYREDSVYTLVNYENSADHSAYRLTLDEPDDYCLIQAVYDRLECKTDFDYKKLIQLLDKDEELAKINARVAQKELKK